MPDWLDFRLSKEVVDRLWKYIEATKKDPAIEKELSANFDLVGQISKSVWHNDEDNCFFEHTVLQTAETMFYRHWEHYYDVHIAKLRPPQKFVMGPAALWVNYQKQHEFNPPHHHDGLLSFVVFMKIPTHWKEQHAWFKNISSPVTSDFQFLFSSPDQRGLMGEYNIPLSSEDEGRMLFFPAQLKHQVFPFYGTEEERITISGNVFADEVRREQRENLERDLEREKDTIARMEGKLRTYKREIK